MVYEYHNSLSLMNRYNLELSESANHFQTPFCNTRLWSVGIVTPQWFLSRDIHSLLARPRPLPGLSRPDPPVSRGDALPCHSRRLLPCFAHYRHELRGLEHVRNPKTGNPTVENRETAFACHADRHSDTDEEAWLMK